MMKNKLLLLFALLSLIFTACSDNGPIPLGPREGATTVSSLNFIGEQVIPDGEIFAGEVIGGLSSIDYVNGTYYIISDAPNAPIRFYTANLTFDETSFSSVEILSQVELLNSDGNPFMANEADPEAIRLDPFTGNIVWTSEGFTGSGVNPFVREAATDGSYISDFTVPALFQSTTNPNGGPRNNGTFEGLSVSHNGAGYWVGMELPLIQDGEAPVFAMDTESPVRIAFVDKSGGSFGRQFAYELDSVARDGGFTVNGLVEVLEFEEDQFLVLERSFASGTTDGGNDVKIYRVDASEATDISSINSLNGATYTKASKTLVFDFNDIRSQLSAAPGSPDNVVDNIEGMTFGPDLPNGNKSLVLVADNNFSAFGAQLNQFIVLEVIR